MGLAYTVCEKPVIGLVLWLASMCVRVPLAGPLPLELGTAGTRIEATFKAPAERKFALSVEFKFPEAARATVNRIVGQNYSSDCEIGLENVPEERRVWLGRPIPFHVVVRDMATGAVLRDETIASVCRTSHGTNSVTRQITLLDLKPGAYALAVTNLEAQPGLEAVKTVILLAG